MKTEEELEQMRIEEIVQRLLESIKNSNNKSFFYKEECYKK